MPRKYRFWKELPIELACGDWVDLVANVIAGLVLALVLGVIIGIFITMGEIRPRFALNISLGILFFILIQLPKKICYLLGFLYRYAFNK